MKNKIPYYQYSILPMLVLILLSVYTCRKSEANLPPVIHMLKPFANMQVSPGDTIHVKADIEDETLVSHVTVQLVGEDNVPVGPAKEYPVDAKSYQLDAHYVLPGSIQYQTSFSLRVRAYDATDYKNKYTPLLMLIPQKERKGILLITQQSASLKHVYLLDSLMQVSNMLQVPGDSGASLLWANHQKLVLAGSIHGDLLVYDLHDTTLSWSLPNVPNPPFSYFTGLTSDAAQLWVGFEEGFISAYSVLGVKSVQTPPTPAYIPEILTRSGSDIAAFWRERFGSSGRIYWHFSVSGALRHYASFPDEAMDIASDHNGSFYVFGNSSGTAIIWEESAGAMAALIDFPGKTLARGLSIGNGEFIVALDDGVHYVDVSGPMSTLIMPNVVADVLEYDRTSGVVLAAEGVKLSIRGISGGTVQTITLQHPITGIHPWYIQ